MVSDKQVESNHRKHRRSSSPSDEVVKSSKRHKHSRSHRHRHHRDKKHDKELQYSDGEEGEIKSGQLSDNNLHVHVDSLPDDRAFGKHAHQPKEGTLHCGSTRESKSDGRSSFSLENSEDKHKISTQSPLNTKDSAEVRPQSRRMSRDRGEKRGRYHDSSRDYCHDTFDLDRKEEKNNRHGHNKEDDWHLSGEVVERERSRERDIDREDIIKEKEQKGSKYSDRDRDLRRDREWDKRKGIEADGGRRKERVSIDKDRRGEKERDHLWDRGNDRGRSRDISRYSSREKERGNERERRSEKDRDKGREFQSDREKQKSLDDGYSEVKHRQSGHSRDDAEGDLDIRSSNSVKGQNTKGGDFKENQGNVERSRNHNHDNGEVAGEEDEERNIVEESRKRMQAILEKYKKNSEQQNGFSSHDKGKDLELADIPKRSSTLGDVLGNRTLEPVASAVNQAKAGLDIIAVDGEVTQLSSAVGESPAQLVISDSDRTLAFAGLGEGSAKGERSVDLFSADIFGESPPAGTKKMGYLRGKGNDLPLRSGLHDNWDDAEGYYSYRIGELLDDRYEIMATHGKGVFSTVVRARDTKAEIGGPEEVAIKIIRNNETMLKAGQTEIQILKKLAGSDPENKRHCVRFLSTFKYRNHLCLVFESLHLNLREVLKKFGVNIGLKLSGVRVYAKQLFISLKHLKNCGVLHCDIKPDNMLVNDGNNILKLCDFGSAMFAGNNEVTPYLVSRFYRAPEIILGLSYDHPLDIWSVGCCLYELYSGKVMFPGSTNNDMLRLHMELKGPFPKKMLRKGVCIDQHFDKNLNFYATEEDSVTGKTMKRMMVNIKPKDFGSVIKGYSGEDRKVLVQFRDLLEKMFILDPQKRLTVSQALLHPFITGK